MGRKKSEDPKIEIRIWVRTSTVERKSGMKITDRSRKKAIAVIQDQLTNIAES